MKATIFKIILFGLFLGALSSISFMVVGLIVYYGCEAVNIFLPISFLRYSAVASFIGGLLGTFAVYMYVFFLTKRFISSVMMTKAAQETLGKYKPDTLQNLNIKG